MFILKFMAYPYSRCADGAKHLGNDRFREKFCQYFIPAKNESFIKPHIQNIHKVSIEIEHIVCKRKRRSNFNPESLVTSD
jgi:RNA-binding protein YlmH